MASVKYDTIEGIAEYLTDIAGLYRLFADRRSAFYERKEHLSGFIILGRWGIDSCANSGRVTIDSSGHDASWIADDLPSVVSMSDFHLLLKSMTITTSFDGAPPQVDSICSECGLGWTLKSSHDFVRLSSRESHDSPPRFEHAICRKLSAEREITKEFHTYLDKAGLGRALLTMIPNEYWKDGAEPWCLVRTPFGTLKMGWRKRVLSIDWSQVLEDRMKRVEKLDIDVRYDARNALRDAFDGKVLFPNDDVTRWETGVHAWNESKIVEYLVVLREKILREPEQAIASFCAKKTES
jgi:hypothetical protein